VRERVVGYIDGFNLYFGIRSKQWDRLLWLDPARLLENLLKPHQSLIAVKYFTARLSGPGPALQKVKGLPKKRIVVAFPPNRRSSLLRAAAHSSLVIGRGTLVKSQFPDRLVKADGIALERPQGWR
jgi:hypothetical protein